MLLHDALKKTPVDYDDPHAWVRNPNFTADHGAYEKESNYFLDGKPYTGAMHLIFDART
jgi:hypothetical protein